MRIELTFPARALATVLFADIVASTEHAATTSAADVTGNSHYQPRHVRPEQAR